MDKSTVAENNEVAIKNMEWPVAGLEYIGVCPVCKNPKREILHKDLIDNVFFCAPGKWDLWRCSGCESAYLDPRPSVESIHLAYENYYTHQISTHKEEVYSSLNPIKKLRRRLGNGFKNWRYGSNAFPASAFGVLAAYMVPGFISGLDRHYRHLPKLSNGSGAVLDVGCGDCSFLIEAKALGWNVVGLDLDPVVVENAAKHGISVFQGGVEQIEGQDDFFDVITLSHVIEHVHEPMKVLQSCLKLLKPGGKIWIETPNIHSLGHDRFHKNWRGLETPRHLVLFNKVSLRETVLNAGFCEVNNLNTPSPLLFIFQKSLNMENGKEPDEITTWSFGKRINFHLISFYELLFQSKREFLTISAFKPEAQI